MVKINSSAAIKEFLDVTKASAGAEVVPNQTEGGFKASLECNPKQVATADIAASTGRINNTASTTIYTTPTKGKFYLCWASLTARFISDAAGALNVAINVTIGGKAVQLLNCINHVSNSSTLSQMSYNAGNHPLLIDAGTNITMTMDAPTTNTSAAASLTGYIDEYNS